MKKTLKVAVVQAKVPTSYKEGETQIERLLKKATERQIDMVGLPEECLVPQSEVAKGYGPFVFLSQMAKKYQVYLFGSNVVKENGLFFNRGFLFDKGGKLVLENDKIVLAPEEVKYYSAGEKIKIVDTEFGKIALLVCKDSFHRFAALTFEQLRENGVDVVLNPTLSLNVAPTTIEYFTSALKALAKWFGVYIIAPGTVGKNMTEVESHGHAIVICPMRLTLCEGSYDKEEVLWAELEPSYQEKYRERANKWQPSKPPEVRVVR